MATVATSAGNIDLALVVLLFIAVSTVRASAIVFQNEDGPLTVGIAVRNFIHMMGLTVLAYAVVLVMSEAGIPLSLGTVLLTGGTFGWQGPRVHETIGSTYRKLTQILHGGKGAAD